MKNLKSALIALALVTLTVGQANTTNNCANAPVSQQALTVTCSQVVAYLQATGHIVLTTPFTENGGSTWTCVTSKHGYHYNTTVYTDGVNVIGYLDEIID
jgi:hypothetical protein